MEVLGNVLLEGDRASNVLGSLRDLRRIALIRNYLSGELQAIGMTGEVRLDGGLARAGW